MSNIVVIGKPGCGKSTVGVVVAKNLALDFIDSDLLIQREEGKRLSEIIERCGDDGFREIENRVNSEIQAEHSVIATGGSVIYGEEAMEHLKSIGTVIYLKLSYEQIEDRLGNLHARGVSIREGQTLHDLYDERCPLYERWADITVDCDGKRLREVVLLITGRLQGEEV